MASFLDFLATLDPDAGKRGRQFEHFVKWFLKNDPEWATQVDEVWLWNEYPKQWGRDKGIDLVLKDKSNKTWAVQAKCYAPEYEITKADVDKFLSESNRRQIDHRLLIATTDRLGANAREVLDGQEKPVVRYLLNHFESAAVEYPASFEGLPAAKRKPSPNPRPHQNEAIDAVISGFRTSNRGQVVMACGTGKTFVCLWVKEQLKAKRTLVLVPSLNLLSQTLSEWTFAARDRFDALCVCSDQTVNRRDEDEAINRVSDIPFPVSNDVAEISHFLQRDRDQVIFSTYQSSPLIAKAQQNDKVPHFDLVIADEAHRCAGKTDTAFHTVLGDGEIRSERRLFATATPRIYKSGLKKAAEEFGVEVVDMNDEKVFGKRFYTLSFGEAIKRDLLTDYRVVIVGVDNERIKEWIENRRLVATETGHETDARSLAGQIGLLKAIKDWNLRRLISFHGRVRRAKEFSEDIIRVGDWLDEKHRPLGDLWTEYVSGEMSTIARKNKLKRLKYLDTGEIGLLSNARCLSEGVDVPALDGVVFVDPRSSEIDIIQSVGRAIRLSEYKAMGTIVIPVFIEQTEDAKEALEASEFKPIWDVLEALKSHDDRLSNELDQLRVELGAKRKRSVRASDLTKIIIDLPASVSDQFAGALRSRLVEQTTESWMFWYGLLERFAKEQGHCRVSQRYITDDGYRLGAWASNQRQYRHSLSIERRTRLEQLGFSWDVNQEAWEEGYGSLKVYRSREGHCRVPRNHFEGEFPLGLWVNNQRARADYITADRRSRLDQIGFSWNVLSDQWETAFTYLKRFREREGHCRVPYSHIEEGFHLGNWVSNQRKEASKIAGSLRNRLNEIGFVWNPNLESWEVGIAHLKTFKEREGHCVVPVSHREDAYLLGQWVSDQRKRKEELSVERQEALEGLGFVWNTFSDGWEKGFDFLKKYYERERHCLVPQDHRENGYRLGVWVSSQRENRNKLSAERQDRLSRLGFVWNRIDALWENGFEHLVRFVKENGNCRVPSTYVSEDRYRLGHWVANQRRNAQMSSARRNRLESVGFSWNPNDDAWQLGFEYLKDFVAEHGHCRVPHGYKTDDGYQLGGWVRKQRSAEDKMPSDRRQRLEAVPGWAKSDNESS